jgi:putative transposase
MGTVRKCDSGAFKANVAVEALKGLKTLNALAAECGVPPVQIAQWKKHALEGMPSLFERALFERTADRKSPADEARLAQLEQEIGSRRSGAGDREQEIGQLKVELNWLRKKGPLLSTRTRT